ncbi:MAG TPA: FAD-dependent oxidoreductase, partial [Candidatus Binatia bacterium]|nr:FAD-dependent oxidoreductase [Candidatus Binatia bacterium]
MNARDGRGTGGAATFARSAVEPLDEHNRQLLDNVAPAAWTNPAPAPRYNLVVVGAGSAGLISAAVAAGLGARVALIERNLMGGDCLNFGCVPSKAMIRSARRLADVRELLHPESPLFDDRRLDDEFARAMERMRAARAEISADDSARRYRDEMGVDVFLGSARFAGADTVEVGGARLRFARAIIATGGRAAVPPVPGLAESGFLTNETIFNLTERPRRLAVIGAGPIGCEVTMLDMAAQLLAREDRDAAQIIETRFGAEGIAMVLGARLTRVQRSDSGRTIHYETDAGA